MKSVKIISSAIAMLFCFVAMAEEKTITGVVTDKTGPLPGVNVVVKGTTRSTQSDFDGKYSIKASKGESLVFNNIGYKTILIKVGDTNIVNARMTSENMTLQEVVIEGMAYDDQGYRAEFIRLMDACNIL